MSDNDKVCEKCGGRYFIDEVGVACHFSETSPDGIDWEADRDHTPYGDELWEG